MIVKINKTGRYGRRVSQSVMGVTIKTANGILTLPHAEVSVVKPNRGIYQRYGFHKGKTAYNHRTCIFLQ